MAVSNGFIFANAVYRKNSFQIDRAGSRARDCLRELVSVWHDSALEMRNVGRAREIHILSRGECHRRPTFS